MSPCDIGYVRDRRKSVRATALVPALINIDDRRYNARVRNIVCDGVMIETAAMLKAGEALLLQCGSIEARARVVWARDERFGLMFEREIDRDQVAQQVVRSAALLGWQEEALSTHSQRPDGQPGMN